VARNRSVRSGANGAPVSARSAVKKPAAPSNLGGNASQTDTSDEDAREEQAAYLQDLKERLEKAESEVEERHKQVKVLNSQLDEALQEQAKLEERAHEEEEKVESLENVRRELTRQHRELEGIYEAERVQAMKEKESTQSREEALQETIQRLKEAMASKSLQPEGDEDASRPGESTSYLPTYQPTYLPTNLPTYLPTYLPTHLPTHTAQTGRRVTANRGFSKLPRQRLALQLLTQPRSRRIICPAVVGPA